MTATSRNSDRKPWRSMVPVTAELDRAIMFAIESAGSAGIICDEIEKTIGRVHQAASANLSHLIHKKGLVVWTGEFAFIRRSGRRAKRWKLSRKARGGAA